jgi:predicted AAA+ superfamily ATPase
MLKKDFILRLLHESNFWGKDQDVGISRNVYLDKLMKMKEMKEAAALVGVRRCGKSTITKQFLKHVIESGCKREQTLYVNFEEPVFTSYLNLDLMDAIYEAYKENINPENPAFVVLDEVQVIPAWEKWVRAKQENEKIKIVITGSSAKLLASEFSTVLSGRNIPLSIYPLSFKEFIVFKGGIKKAGRVFLEKRKLNILLEEYLEFGGFPRPVLESRKENKAMLLNEYFEAIVLRDVAARYNVKEINILRALATILLTNVSSLVSIGKLTRVIQEAFKQKTSLETISRFLQYMESAFLVFLVPIFSYKIKNQLQYPRKVYCVDTGLRNTVSFRFLEDLGKLYENAVFMELKRAGKNVFYWKDTSGREVDFIIKDKLKVKEAIQVCVDMKNSEVKERELSALVSCLKEFGLKEGLIINEDEEGEEKIQGKKIKYVPLWKWLLE